MERTANTIMWRFDSVKVKSIALFAVVVLAGMNAQAARSTSGTVSPTIAANGKISGKLLEDGSPCLVMLYAPPKGAFAGWCEAFAVELSVEQGVAVDVAVEPQGN